MYMSWLVLLVGLMVLVPITEARSQQEALDSLIYLALVNNAELSASTYARQSSEHSARGAGALPDPALSLGLLNLPVNSLALDETPMSGVSVGLSQRIPWPGKLGAKSDLANAYSEESTASEQIVRNRIVRYVTDAYLDYSYWSLSLPVIREHLLLLQETRDIAEVRYSNGDVPVQDVLRAGSMVSRTEIRILQAEQKRLSALLRIRQAVGDTTISSAFPAHLPEPPTDSIEVTSIEVNPQLSRASSMVRQARTKYRLARQEYWPDFTVGVDYTLRRKLPGDPVEGADYLTFRAGFSFPLWFFAKQKHEVRAAEQAVAASKERERSVHDMLSAQYHDAASNLAVIRESLRKYDTSLVPEASAAAEAAEISYEVGRIDFDALLSSQSDAFEIRIERLGLLREYHKTRAALAELTGDGTRRNRE